MAGFQQSLIDAVRCRQILSLHGLVRSAGFIASALVLGASSDSHAQSAIRPVLQEQTPLILKDGRIAGVSVHIIPFEIGSDVLSAEVGREFDTRIAELATDCFLTAQAIGHVEPGEGAQGDTLTDHRLARARSDEILRLLSGGGVPQTSVASVWDWQFIIGEPRVTLWVFELREGEDCSGTSLEVDQQVASLDQSKIADVAPEEPGETVDEPAGEIAESESTTTAIPDVEEVAEPALDVEEVAEPAPDVEEAVEPKAIAAIAAASAVEKIAKTRAIEKEIAEIDSEVRPIEALDSTRIDPVEAEVSVPKPLDFSAIEELTAGASSALADQTHDAAGKQDADGPVIASVLGPRTAAPALPKLKVRDTIEAPAQATAAVETTEDISKADAAQELSITFAVNSSYLPRGAFGKIRGLLRSMADGHYEAELVVSVGTGDVSGVSQDEALRYNRWMAERRVGRVQAQIEKNISGKTLTLRERYKENDGSRQVVILFRPLT